MDRLEENDGPAIEEAARRYRLEEIEIRAVITQESRGVATANAGANQRDHGRNAPSGLMQVTADTWENVRSNHAELRQYAFAQHRYDRRINILFGAAALADKRDALERLGVQVDPRALSHCC